jgi:outer membrane protease
VVRLRVYLAAAIAVALAIAAPAQAADWPALPQLWSAAAPSPVATPVVTKASPVPDVEYFMPRPLPAWQIEIGARYWLGTANTGKTLYGAQSMSNVMVSRLTYSDMTTNAGELFARAAFTNGFFVKGYAGTGAMSFGNLKDEDFPPGITPYSSTTSDQKDGYLNYASGDVGYDVVRGGDFRVGVLTGYHYFMQEMNAYGCTQTATNPVVCQPAIPTTVEAISQTNHWQSIRVGLDGSILFAERFKLGAEAAYLPFVFLNGADTHWLRIGTAVGDFTGPIPENGRGQGYQFEVSLSYQVTEYASVGIGGRYWHMQANGNSNFQGNVVGVTAFPQPVDWKTDILGAFIQASLKFGPFPVGRLN